MDAMLDWLARYARPILLWVPVLLAAGAMVTVLGLPLVGWAMYGAGYIGLMVALAAVVAVYRGPMDWFAWVSFGVLYVGLLIGLPVLLIMLGHYAQNPELHEAAMPFRVTPLGMIAGVVTWVGLALFGWAMYRVRAFPTAAAVVFVVAAVLGLGAEFSLFAPAAWGLAVILVAYALVWIAPPRAIPARARAN
jgi:hypothetical protein